MLELVDVMPRKQSGDSFDMKELAARICRDYLHGAWKKVNVKNINFKQISGGLSNLLYHVSLPDSLVLESKRKDEPREVLIRIYRQTHGEGAIEALITESVIFTLLSERGLGPKLHGIFPGGRLEQYIDARPLLTRELAEEKLSVRIAQKMASIHSMEVPLHKEASWLWNTIDKWLQICDEKLTGSIPEMFRSVLEQGDLKLEAQWLRNKLENVNSPVLFCHNDLQEGNILISRDVDLNVNDDPRLIIIDYEYCSYNYRAFDIANHFIEWVFDYTIPEYPFFKEDWTKYPTEQQRLRFIRSYLDEIGSRENPKKIAREVEVFTLAPHFFWCLWSLINVDTSQIPFGYWEFASTRLNSYFQLKHKLFGNTQLKRKMDELTV